MQKEKCFQQLAQKRWANSNFYCKTVQFSFRGILSRTTEEQAETENPACSKKEFYAYGQFCGIHGEKRPDSQDNAKKAGIILLAVLLCAASVFLVFVTHIPFILVITCAIIYGAYYLISGTSVEYEYAVTNGEMDVDKIIARRKRVHLITVDVGKFDAYGEMTDDIPDDTERTVVLCADNTGEGEYYADLETEEYGATRIIFTPNDAVQDAIAAALPRQLRFQKGQA